MTTLELPIIVGGELIDDLASDPVRFRYRSELEVALPRLQPKMLRAIEQSGNPLAALSIDDITNFLAEVGRRWCDESYPLRREALDYASRITGYAPRIIERDFFTIGEVCSRPKLNDILDTDLGDRYLMDEWRPSQAVFRRTVPRGRVLHVMVGNVPMAALFTIVRSVLGKNQTIAKLPSRDPVSALFFARACLDVDPHHPVSRSLSVVYWDSGSELEDRALARSQVVCVWGQREAVESLRRKTRYGQEFLDFGPKRSIQLIGADVDDWDYAAMRAAYDASIYDQEACFSPQVTYVEGDPGVFVERLLQWLGVYLEAFPRAPVDVDAAAHIAQARLDAKLEGMTVHASDGPEWTVVVGDRPVPVEAHPLGRTMYVFRVDDLRDALDWLPDDLQSAGVFPWTRALELGDALVARGVSRIVELGLMGFPRSGFIHDGMLPLSRLVRWCSIERPLTFKYFATDDPEDYDRKLFFWKGPVKSPRSYRFRGHHGEYQLPENG